MPASGLVWQDPASSTPTQAAAPQQEESTVLELGKVIERDLTAGQKHHYQIALSAGQFMKVEITDHGTDVGVILYWPNGETTNPWQPVGEPFDVKPISAVAESAGVFRIEIYTAARATAGRYEIRLTEVRLANERDRALQEANALFRAYVQLRDQGRYVEAGPNLQRALEIRERLLGEDNLLVANTLGFSASYFDNIGDYASAESANLRALKIKEKLLGPDHPDIAQEFLSLGGTYQHRGDDLKAEEAEKQGLAILQKTHQGETFTAAALLEQLGFVRYATGDYQSAQEYALKARAIWEKLLGADHYHLAPSYTFLGRVAYDQADYTKAEMMYQKALNMSEKGLGAENLHVTTYRNDLAKLYCTRGEYSKGEALYQQSLDIHRQRGAMSHPEVQTALFGLARCYTAEGNIAEAVKVQIQGSDIEDRYVAVNLAVGSEREKRAFLASLTSRSSRNISLHARLAPDAPLARDLAITTVLRNKGRVQDAMSAGLAGLRRRLGEDDQKQLDQLNDVTARLARLVLNGPQKLQPAEYQQRIKGLEDQRESLEDELNRRSSGFYVPSKPVTLAAVQTAIPDQAALIEFAVYRPFDPAAATDQKAYGSPHYIAYVVRNKGEVGWAELGEAATIDKAVDTLRNALRDPQRQDVVQLARAVDALIIAPVRAQFKGVTQLLISPDGELNLIPFEALKNEHGQYLAEGYSITYLTTGRDLIRMQTRRASKSGPVVIANPAFGEPPLTEAPGAGRERFKVVAARGNRRSITTGETLAGVYFAPLVGTAQEARIIHWLFPEARLLTGEHATKAELARVNAPSMLHIATHGFFLQNAERKYSSDGSGPDAAENPLLRSGLALSGANLNQRQKEDGILTALEASNLNLWGTRLVTLSACETGIGEVKDGEGVYGLRRSFFLAGSETLVMSLWSVSDSITREMMTSYYTGLKHGLGRAEALHRAELSMLKRNGRKHPFYWASFIQAGEWANLEGQR
ncbi:MAG TPA: CHAT domain-containing tetratricopeptide repeat protein [Candidatus Angelobacter sp.]|nr:CHAT domain-containing tetratricopeptide repeat protein [Candidatus Angelobacter sp.]